MFKPVKRREVGHSKKEAVKLCTHERVADGVKSILVPNPNAALEFYTLEGVLNTGGAARLETISGGL